MKLATTTDDFTIWGASYEESIRLIHGAGFKHIDISLNAAICESPTYLEDAKRLREYAEKLGVEFVQAHSPDGNAFEKEKLERLITMTNHSFEICEILGIPHTVVHSGWKNDCSRDEYHSGNLKFYERLYPTMEKTGVSALIENTTSKNISRDTYCFFDADQMLDFLKEANHPLMHAVWDTGHGNTEGNQYEQLVTLGQELYGIHVHDNTEHGDEHLIPFLGTLNMDDLINGLIDANYQGCFTFEAIATLRKANSRHGKRHIFEREKRLLNPTIEMQIDLERLLYTIGKHCLEAYKLFEG